MRMRIIPDRLFYIFWQEAEKTENKTDYIRKFTLVGSSDYVDFIGKYHLEYEEGVSMLNEIYDKAKLSFKEILQLAKKKKADISNTFCIPIRTVEDWYSGKSKCNAYIRLALLRQYHLLFLGKYIRTEAENEFKQTIPSVYKKKAATTQIKSDEKASSFKETSEKENADALEEVDDLLSFFRKKRESMPTVSFVETRSVLEKTSFIDDILKNKKKPLQ